MTDNPDASLAFCQFCGTKRIVAGQEYCAKCGQKLLQASDIQVAPVPEPSFVPPEAPPPPVVPVPASAPAWAPAAPPIPEQPPAPAWAPTDGAVAAADVVPTPPAYGQPTPPPSAGYTYPPGYGQPPAPGAWPGSPAYPGTAPFYPGMAPARRNPALIPILIGVVLVVVLALSAGIFVLGSLGSSAGSSPVAASSNGAGVSTNGVSATPTDTPIPEPTPTDIPVATTGTLTGQMVAVGGASISGLGVILCQSMGTGCTTDPTLTATSDASGQFEIDGISAGTYYVLYAPPGAASSWSSEQIVDINDQSASCLGEAFTSSLPSGCESSIMFSDDSAMVLHADTFTVTGSGMSIDIGTVCSPKHGLCLDFDNGEPLSVEMTPGMPATVEVTVRGTA